MHKKLRLEDQIAKYEKKIFDLNQLLEISSSLNSTMDFNNLIDSILYICMGQMRTIKAGIFVRKSLDCEDLVFHRNNKGFELQHDTEYIIEEDNPLISYFSENFFCHTLLELSNIMQETTIQSLHDLDPTLVVPMRSKNRINGILILGERIDEETFSEEDKNYLLQIANLASIAIHNSFLFEMTTTDMMTKLKMKHFFMTTLAEKQEIGENIDQNMAVIMMDIDHFKILNDTYGHTCGDIVLINVANRIQNNIRQGDIAARYGGEEFVVLLPESNLKTAWQVSERIRSDIEKMEIEYDHKKIHATISLGIAIYDASIDKSSQNFIERADKALYYSKQHGRNKISQAEETKGIPPNPILQDDDFLFTETEIL